MKMKAKHWAGDIGSQTISGVITVPFSRVTGLPVVRSLKCSFGTSPGIALAFAGKNLRIPYLGMQTKEYTDLPLALLTFMG